MWMMRRLSAVPAATTFSLRKSASRTLCVLTTHYKKCERATDPRWEGIDMERFADEPADLLIVGGGPAGLAAAIKFKQLCNEEGLDYRVTLLEKAPLIGGHTYAPEGLQL